VIPGNLGEPKVAVRTGRDAFEFTVGGDAGTELGNAALGCNTADAILRTIGEPEVPVRTGRDVIGVASAGEILVAVFGDHEVDRGLGGRDARGRAGGAVGVAVIDAGVAADRDAGVGPVDGERLIDWRGGGVIGIARLAGFNSHHAAGRGGPQESDAVAHNAGVLGTSDNAEADRQSGTGAGADREVGVAIGLGGQRTEGDYRGLRWRKGLVALVAGEGKIGVVAVLD